MIMKNLRAQFWSFDMVFAIVIFSVAITVLAYTWYSVNNQLSLAYGSGSVIAQLQTHALAQSLMSTGYPNDWMSAVNTTNTLTWTNVSIGLASAPGSTNMSIRKVYTLLAMSNYNYQATKQELGVGYDYYITIVGSGLNMTLGENPATNGALSVYVDKRSALLAGIPVTLTVYVWTNTPLAVG